MLALPFPDIDPVLFSVDLFGMTLAIRWYALAYIAGLLLGWALIVALVKRPALWPGATAPMTPKQPEDLLTWMILSVIIGGRLGYVFFYQPAMLWTDPMQVLRVWDGGMSFHGGFLGVIVGVALWARLRGVPLLQVSDAVAFAAPIGIFFGRLANFINGELWGRPTDLPWAVAFPDPAAQLCPPDWIGICTRHPSQLYEALLEGALLFALMAVLILRRHWLHWPGRIMGLFFLGYGLARSFVELFRQPDAQFQSAGNPLGHAIQFGTGPDALGLTMGQILSLPMILIGIALIVSAKRPA
uniref:prolipoprotein diacylglyceryl transferase n=1 Tax=Oceanomicrobium pacificus TaxID=2692916 RepID=UPI001371F274|nr:prolipoprotein diacylglyceryl transferase [Oceanomicrobium pacificus]